jgi:very-short-patch-repair endonuclease
MIRGVRRDSMYKERAQELRGGMTAAERRLWWRLRYEQLGHKFRRQYAIGTYITDFACIKGRLVVEVDGESHTTDDAERHDAQRTAYLEKCGYRVLRFWNTAVLNDTDAVVGAILGALGPEVPLIADGPLSR